MKYSIVIKLHSYIYIYIIYIYIYVIGARCCGVSVRQRRAVAHRLLAAGGGARGRDQRMAAPVS